jgi:S-adenosylmethionine hydrolase
MIAVVSDFGADSFYVGVLKGALTFAAPRCRIVDVTHSIEPHAIDQGSFILDTIFDFFPAGTVFLAVVDPGVGGERRNLIVETGGRYVVGPDNGLAAEVAARLGESRTYVIDVSRLDRFRIGPPVGRTFLGRDVFAPAAGAVASGLGPAAVAAESTEPPSDLDVPAVGVERGRISAPGRYADAFGNILTAITHDQVIEAFEGAPPEEIRASIDGRDAGTLCRYFAERPAGSLMAVVNSWGRVEISMAEGSAVERFAGARLRDLTVELSRTRA